MRAVANWSTTQCGTFVAQTATFSPRRTPSAMSPRAAAVDERAELAVAPAHVAVGVDDGVPVGVACDRLVEQRPEGDLAQQRLVHARPPRLLREVEHGVDLGLLRAERADVVGDHRVVVDAVAGAELAPLRAVAHLDAPARAR